MEEPLSGERTGVTADGGTHDAASGDSSCSSATTLSLSRPFSYLLFSAELRPGEGLQTYGAELDLRTSPSWPLASASTCPSASSSTSPSRGSGKGEEAPEGRLRRQPRSAGAGALHRRTLALPAGDYRGILQPEPQLPVCEQHCSEPTDPVAQTTPGALPDHDPAGLRRSPLTHQAPLRAVRSRPHPRRSTTSRTSTCPPS